MTVRVNLFIFLLLTLNASAQQGLRINIPPASPEIFGVNIISTGLSERDFALSPGGNEIFYTLQSPQGVFQTILHIGTQANES